jgi:sec-independent protein translocase protein TatB
MFDVGFSELVLIFIVGLLVLGPERLPGVIRTGSLWLARLRRSFNEIRTEIERESGLDDLKRDLHNQSIMDSLKDVRDDLQQAQHQLQQLPQQVGDAVERIGQSDTADTAPAQTDAPPPDRSKQAS